MNTIRSGRKRRRNKYGAKRTVLDGIAFASKREAKRYGELKLLEKAGVIRGLQLQQKFPIIINGVACFNWIADFVYFEGNGRVIEDCKGMRTPIYRLKKKCIEAMYNIKILET